MQCFNILHPVIKLHLKFKTGILKVRNNISYLNLPKGTSKQFIHDNSQNIFRHYQYFITYPIFHAGFFSEYSRQL